MNSLLQILGYGHCVVHVFILIKQNSDAATSENVIQGSKHFLVTLWLVGPAQETCEMGHSWPGVLLLRT